MTLACTNWADAILYLAVAAAYAAYRFTGGGKGGTDG